MCGVSMWLPAEHRFVKHGLHDLPGALEFTRSHSILPVTTLRIWGKICCHAQLFRLHNGSQGLKSTWRWGHGFCTCGEILDASSSATAVPFSRKEEAPGILAPQDQLERVHHLTLCFLFLRNLQAGWEMPTATVYCWLVTPSLRMSFSHSLCFLAKTLVLEAATCLGLWRRTELHLLR